MLKKEVRLVQITKRGNKILTVGMAAAMLATTAALAPATTPSDHPPKQVN